MFTGLVEELAEVAELKRTVAGRRAVAVRIGVLAPKTSVDTKVGDSICVSGCCLTVVSKRGKTLAFDAGSETLSRTHFSRLEAGSAVNLERSLQLGDRLGGHLVTGHVDDVATLIKRRDEANWSHFTFRVSSRLTRQMASKGSVAVDGVSLTLVEVELDRFSVALIPHTLDNTTLGTMEIGSLANLETDLLAKYVERQLESRSRARERDARARAWGEDDEHESDTGESERE
jgi:riboflavin synthase